MGPPRGGRVHRPRPCDRDLRGGVPLEPPGHGHELQHGHPGAGHLRDGAAGALPAALLRRHRDGRAPERGRGHGSRRHGPLLHPDGLQRAARGADDGRLRRGGGRLLRPSERASDDRERLPSPRERRRARRGHGQRSERRRAGRGDELLRGGRRPSGHLRRRCGHRGRRRVHRPLRLARRDRLRLHRGRVGAGRRHQPRSEGQCPHGYRQKG